MSKEKEKKIEKLICPSCKSKEVSYEVSLQQIFKVWADGRVEKTFQIKLRFDNECEGCGLKWREPGYHTKYDEIKTKEDLKG